MARIPRKFSGGRGSLRGSSWGRKKTAAPSLEKKRGGWSNTCSHLGSRSLRVQARERFRAWVLRRRTRRRSRGRRSALRAGRKTASPRKPRRPLRPTPSQRPTDRRRCAPIAAAAASAGISRGRKNGADLRAAGRSPAMSDRPTGEPGDGADLETGRCGDAVAPSKRARRTSTPPLREYGDGGVGGVCARRR